VLISVKTPLVLLSFILHNKNRMKKALFIIVGILTFLSIPATVYFVGQNQEMRKKAAPATTASLSPAALTTTVGETIALSVEVNTGSNQVVSAGIVVEFDPTKFEAQSITNGPFFPKILVGGSISPGSASITVSAPSTTEPITGSGIAVIVRLKAITGAPSPVSVKLSDSTFIAGLGEIQTNVLVGTTPATITINPLITQPSRTPTPTPLSMTPTPTAPPLIQVSDTPTPTLVLSSSPGSTLSSTLSLTPTSTLTPTPTGSGLTKQASSGGTLVLIDPIDESLISSSTTFQGKAPPGSTVTIVIHSDPITTTVEADENGNWTYTPTAPLDAGEHTIIASAQNPTSGAVETANATFQISDSTSLEPMPKSGTAEYTILLLFVSAIFIFFGRKMLLTNQSKDSQL
jgi:hypothetical protein